MISFKQLNANGKYYYFTAFGRLGEPGKASTELCSSEHDAIHSFKKQFK